MSAVTSDSMARDWARRLEQKEAERSGLPLAAARRRVALRLGVPPGTLENLRRDRVKGVREWLFRLLKQAVVAEMQREIAALSHEMDRLAGAGLDAGDPEIETVVASLDQARAALRRGGGSG